jgi:hypothetical protein
MSENEVTHHINRLKESFLCAAAGGGRIEECASLLDLGAEVNVTDRTTDGRIENDAPLLAAVRNGHKDVAALLLAHGANPMRCSNDGDTVLHLAAASGNEGIASLFAPNAAILARRTNRDGMTAVDVAVSRGYTSFAEFLSGLCEGRLDGDDSRDDIPEEEELDYSDASTVLSSNGSHCENECVDDHSFEEESDTASFHIRIHQEDDDDDQTYEDVDDSDHTNHVYEGDCADPESEDVAEQLQYMTQLAHSQSIELYQAKYALNDTLQERDRLKKELTDLKTMHSSEVSLGNNKSLAELTSLEEQLKRSLDRITKRKEELSRDLEEERSCVICRENPKTVLLMTCRHLCVCSECGHREELDRCPLCREIILERINVYS